MKIDINLEVADHLERCKSLARDAEEDSSSPLSQRAAAMTALSNLLRDVTKTQLEVINMSRLQTLEQTIIDLLNEVLTDVQIAEFLVEYERRLSVLEHRDE